MTDAERFAVIERALNEAKISLDQILVRLAVRDERERNVDEKLAKMQQDVDKNLERLEARIDKVNDTVNKFAIIVVLAVIGGVMQWILKGGLANVL